MFLKARGFNSKAERQGEALTFVWGVMAGAGARVWVKGTRVKGARAKAGAWALAWAGVGAKGLKPKG